MNMIKLTAIALILLLSIPRILSTFLTISYPFIAELSLGLLDSFSWFSISFETCPFKFWIFVWSSSIGKRSLRPFRSSWKRFECSGWFIGAGGANAVATNSDTAAAGSNRFPFPKFKTKFTINSVEVNVRTNELAAEDASNEIQSSLNVFEDISCFRGNRLKIEHQNECEITWNKYFRMHFARNLSNVWIHLIQWNIFLPSKKRTELFFFMPL